MAAGWECPRCGECYGPSVEKCANEACKKLPRSVKQAGDLGAPLSGTDLHEQLYAPSINEFPDGSWKKPGRGGGGGGGGESDGSNGIF